MSVHAQKVSRSDTRTALSATTGAVVLVAEGDDQLRDGLVTRMAQAGFEVHSTGWGRRCIQEVDTDPIGLVVLDVLLEDASGLEVLHEIRAKHPALPVVLVTGRRCSLAELLALEMGAVAYVADPLKATVLTAVVQRCLAPRPCRARHRNSWYRGISTALILPR